MNISTAFPSDYLKAADVDPDKTFTIAKVEIETVGQGKKAEQKPVIYFKEAEKGLVCNRTNGNTIAGLHGPETDNWIGKRITLYAAEVEFAGETMLGIRVRLKPTANGQAAPAVDASGAAAARKSAGEAFFKAHPGTPRDEVIEGWKQAVKAYFNGKPENSLSAFDWGNFVLDGFKRKPVESPIEPEAVFDDLPF